MRVAVRIRRLLRKAVRAKRFLLPPRVNLGSLERKVLAAAWSLAALTTLVVALSQSLHMFLLSSLAVLFGTLAALWMLNGLARR